MSNKSIRDLAHAGCDDAVRDRVAVLARELHREWMSAPTENARRLAEEQFRIAIERTAGLHESLVGIVDEVFSGVPKKEKKKKKKKADNDQ